jgi:hypothetical protein
MCSFFISSSNIYLVLFVNISVNAVLPLLLEEVESCVASKPVSAFAEERFEAPQCLHRLDTSSKMDSNFCYFVVLYLRILFVHFFLSKSEKCATVLGIVLFPFSGKQRRQCGVT